jgi:NADPH-dependent ferric siderophore reductase
LLADDETALPAITRLLNAAPPDAREHAVVEVHVEPEQRPIATRSRIELA